MCGLGSGLNSTASFAIIASHYKQDREKMIGMLESSSGVGLLLGPLFGAILYQLGGYMLPFFAMGIIYIIYLLLIAGMYFALYPLIAYTLSRIQAVEEESPKKQPLMKEAEKNFSLSKLFLLPRFTFGLISQVIVYSSVTFL